jgi:hypothetical protein
MLNKFTGSTWKNQVTTPKSFNFSSTERRYGNLQNHRRLYEDEAMPPHSLSDASDDQDYNAAIRDLQVKLRS